MKIAKSSFIEMATGIFYKGVENGEAIFDIRGNEYRYLPDSEHSDVNKWDEEIKNQVGEYGKTGTALNFVKNTSSSYRKVESAKRETTTTADMDLQLVDTTGYDKSHDKDRINDKPKYNKDGEVIQ